jgi:murein tripeptide amidase MpaA
VTYLNTDEVDSALHSLASFYTAFSELIELPYRTIEGRAQYALRIGRHSNSDALLFAANVHAREWGGADACVYFAADLLEAYTSGTGLQFGNRFFSPLAIAAVVERLNVVVLPCVNPDGRIYDMQHDALWRRNRNPAEANGIPNRIGVDVNRNHSFLWDHRRAFAAAAQNTSSMGSDDTLSENYRGSAPDSEPETRNIHWLLDRFRFTHWYVDIHCYEGDLLYSWGDDKNQSDSPAMNFLNTDYDDQRGTDGGYGEYITSQDLTIARGAAERAVAAMNEVRGKRYVALQSVSLWGSPGKVTYPTSGASDDYAFSRHRSDCTKGKVYAFTLEFGFPGADSRSSFHPPWPEMEQLVKEVDAGLLELCVAATPTWVPPWKILWRWLFPWQIWDPMIRILGRGLWVILNALGIRRFAGRQIH